MNELSAKEIIHEYRVAIQGVKVRLQPNGNKEVKNRLISWFINDFIYTSLMETLTYIDEQIRK